jgi:hypothetical protein
MSISTMVIPTLLLLLIYARVSLQTIRDYTTRTGSGALCTHTTQV